MSFWIGLITGVVCTLIFCAMCLKDRFCDGNKCKNNQLKKLIN